MPHTLVITLLAIAVAVLAFRLRHQRDAYAKTLKTTRRQREEAKQLLIEGQHELDTLLDALGDAFLIVNQAQDIRKANGRAKEIFRGQELIGRTLTEALMNETFTHAITEMMEDRSPQQRQITLPANSYALGRNPSDGETAWVVKATPLPNHDDDPLTCIIIRDISTEHRSEQIRTDFVANASHELRTPLAIINGYLENLIDDNVVEETQMARKLLSTMRKHGQRLSRLIDDMLVISRLESGESAAINREPFNLIDCLEDVLERLDHLFTSNGTRLVREYGEANLTINGDRFYWTQVFFNLIENAIKQNPGRALTITLSAEKLSEGQAKICVTDNGIGIPSSHLPFIFKRFYRVDKHHTQSDIKGTGLGLSIVKRAIEAHGASIEASSTPGSQTRFTIVTPLAAEDDFPEPQNPSQ